MSQSLTRRVTMRFWESNSESGVSLPARETATQNRSVASLKGSLSW